MAKDPQKLPVSVVVLTKNEEKNLPDCLRSLGWAAQVLVVDSQSTDKTVAVARRFGAEVWVRPWPGYTAQRNFALSKCRQPWVLSVDADERVAPDLEQAIRDLLKGVPDRQGYQVPEVNNYFGRWLRFAGIYPSEHTAFFRRVGARYESGKADVHEGVRIPDPGHLKGHLIHQAYPSVELALEKLNHYTSVEAQGRLKRGDRAGFYGLLWRPLERFFKNYFLKLGFLDGIQGLLYCFLTGYYTFVFNLKIWEQSREKRG
ncbi:MAG: glycosyltransferase family 2 protein [candidate division FCPU426 bacterium]